MSLVSRMVEERLAEAAANGELDAGPLQGKPIPGIDQQRPEGWWAAQFVRRERSHDRRELADAAVAKARVGFWQAASIEELRERVGDANQMIATANINLIETDQIELFDPLDIRERWLALRNG